MKNSLTQNDLKCGMIAYEVSTLNIRTVLFVSDVYNYRGMNSKCIDYKPFYKKDDGNNEILFVDCAIALTDGEWELLDGGYDVYEVGEVAYWKPILPPR